MHVPITKPTASKHNVHTALHSCNKCLQLFFLIFLLKRVLTFSPNVYYIYDALHTIPITTDTNNTPANTWT